MRVIAGRLRGRALRAPQGASTRPTTDRVREALFSVLGELTGEVVLDLYAGSGALGIEALSRGADRAVFVECGRGAQSAIRENITRLDLSQRTELLTLRVERARDALVQRGPFGVVFCDPPWDAVPTVLGRLPGLLSRPVVQSGSVLVLEHSSRHASFIPHDVVGPMFDQRTYGDTTLTLFSVDAV